MAIKLEDKDFKCISSSYSIMTINMNVKNPEKGGKAPTATKRRELVISAIKDFPASVIFCQEVTQILLKEVVKNCGPGDYEFAFTGKEAAVMWRRSDFKGGRKSLQDTDPSIIEITKSLKEKYPGVDVSEARTRTAMVKLTSVKTGASFLAVSWHGKWKAPRDETKLKALDGTKLKAMDGTKLTALHAYALISFLCKVCEHKLHKVSSFIIGGDFNLDTSKIDLTKHEGVMISRYELCDRDQKRLKQPRKAGRGFTQYKDTFIVSVKVPSNGRPLTGDITVSSVRQLEPEIESSDNKLMDHVPVVSVLNLVWPYKKPYIEQDRDTVTEDTSKSRTLNETTNKKDTQGLTPEKTEDTAEVVSGDSDVRRKLFEDGNEENNTTDKKKRHSSGKVEVKENEIIEDYLKNRGKHIKRIKGDGHCMVNAFSLGLKEKDGQGDYSKKSLLTKIEKELWDNKHRYSDFDDIKKEDLNAYIKDKQYNSSLVDLIPHVVANITNTSILILKVRNGQVHTTPIHPKPEEESPEKNGKTGEKPEKEERTIYVYKTGDHYDAILNRDEAASGLKVEGVRMIRSMEDPPEAETSVASDAKEETCDIMTINMKCKGQISADKEKKLVISTIEDSKASVIFCQNAPGYFKTQVVEKCGNDGSSYQFVPKDIRSRKKEGKVAVMWRNTDFEGKEVEVTEKLPTVRTRSAMVKLTCTRKGTTKASFLAVSWNGPENVDEASKAFYGLICFVREVCENEKLSWFIIGGDFNLDTSKVDLPEYEGVTISCGPSFVPFRDTFVFSIPSNKLSSTVDITVSEVKPLELGNESSQNGKLKHVPVVGVLNLGQDRASTSCSSQPPSAISEGYVTREDFERLFSLVERSFKLIDAKIDSLTAEVEKIKLAPPKEQSSDRESTSEKKKKETGK